MNVRTLGFWFLLVGVSLCFATMLPAADEKRAGEKNDVKKELERLEADWASAVETNDPKRIERFFADDFLFVGAKGILQDRVQHLEDFRSGKLHVDSVKSEDQTIHVYNGAAVVSSRVMVKGKIKINNMDVDISGLYQFTDTLVKQNEKWLAAARQQTKISTGKQVRR
jgi:hypothetical protein